jgi:hypothetical protein
MNADKKPLILPPIPAGRDIYTALQREINTRCGSTVSRHEAKLILHDVLYGREAQG